MRTTRMEKVTIDEIKSIMVAWLMPKLPKFLKNSCMLMSDPGHKDNDTLRPDVISMKPVSKMPVWTGV